MSFLPHFRGFQVECTLVFFEAIQPSLDIINGLLEHREEAIRSVGVNIYTYMGS